MTYMWIDKIGISKGILIPILIIVAGLQMMKYTGRYPEFHNRKFGTNHSVWSCSMVYSCGVCRLWNWIYDAG